VKEHDYSGLANASAGVDPVAIFTHKSDKNSNFEPQPSKSQIDRMKHAVGMCWQVNKSRWGYRNRYVTYPGGDSEKEMLSLVEGGYCTVLVMPDWYAGEGVLLFSVTQKGCEAIGMSKAATARALNRGGRR
jgi:hypothetical protein